MRLSYKYRAYANKQTLDNAARRIELCRNLHNIALEHRITCWNDDRVNVSYYDQQYALIQFRRDNPEYFSVNMQCLREVLRRVDKAYSAFYRRIKNGEKAGYPRFKSKGRYDSFTLEQAGWKLDNSCLLVRGVGVFKLKLSRPILGKIKTVTIRRTSSGEWFATFSCDNVPERILEPSDKSVGIDVGIKSFAVDSDGLDTPNPKHLRHSLKLLRLRQRRLSRRIKGSNRRARARLLVAKAHEQVENQRSDFLHKLANYYIKNYGVISIENLNIQGMVKNHCLALSIQDGSWGRFFELLSYKAECAGRQLIKVDARNTSQLCSSCGKKVEKTLAERIHACPYCGVVIDRDYNAALNIKSRGLGHSPHASTRERTPCVA